MSSLKFERNNIVKKIIPSINNTTYYLNQAYNALYMARVPNCCSGIGVGSAKSSIDSTRRNLKKINNWCVDSVNKYTRIENFYASEARTLPKDVMSLRGNKMN